MRYLVLDTSFLMALSELRSLSLKDVERLYPDAILVTTGSVISELRELLRRKRKVSASVAIQVVEKHNIKVFEEYRGNADDDIVKLARKVGATVVTFDLELRRRLLREGIPVIYLRAGRKLVLEDPLRLSKES